MPTGILANVTSTLLSGMLGYFSLNIIMAITFGFILVN